MSRPDRVPDVAVDFSPPQSAKRAVPLAAIALLGLAAVAIVAAVTQLLLH